MISWLKQRLVPLLQDTFRRWGEDDGMLLSAAMAYYAAFSLFPLCLVLIAGLGLVMRFSSKAQNAQEQLISLVSENTSSWLAGQLQTILAGVETNAALGGPLGLLVLLAAAIGIFVQLDTIFDRIWGAQRRKQQGMLGSVKRALVERLTAFLMLLGLGGLLVVLFLADMVLAGLRPYVSQLPAGNYAWQGIQLIISLSLNAILFGALYKALPKERVAWRDAFAGGVLVALVWELGQQVLAPFVIGEKYSAYGVVGSFIAVMIWMYYASAMVFLGAEFVQALQAQRSEDDRKITGFGG